MSPGFRRWLPLLLILPVTGFALLVGLDSRVRELLLYRKERVFDAHGRLTMLYRQSRWTPDQAFLVTFRDGRRVGFTGSSESPRHAVVAWTPEGEVRVYLFPGSDGRPSAMRESPADGLPSLSETEVMELAHAAIARRGWAAGEVPILSYGLMDGPSIRSTPGSDGVKTKP